MGNLITEDEVLEILQKKSRNVIARLQKKFNFPRPVLSHPARFSENDIKKWIEKGGINQSS